MSKTLETIEIFGSPALTCKESLQEFLNTRINHLYVEGFVEITEIIKMYLYLCNILIASWPNMIAIAGLT